MCAGRASGARLAVDRGWPLQVALRSDFVMRDFDLILSFLRSLSLSARGHSVNDGKEWSKVYYFAEADDAAKFMARFGGEKFKDRKSVV